MTRALGRAGDAVAAGGRALVPSPTTRARIVVALGFALISAAAWLDRGAVVGLLVCGIACVVFGGAVMDTGNRPTGGRSDGKPPA